MLNAAPRCGRAESAEEEGQRKKSPLRATRNEAENWSECAFALSAFDLSLSLILGLTRIVGRADDDRGEDEKEHVDAHTESQNHSIGNVKHVNRIASHMITDHLFVLN